MYSTRTLLGLLTLGILFSCAPAPPTPSPVLNSVAAPIDDLLQAAVDLEMARGVVAMVVDREGVLYEGAFGQQDVARGVDMRVDSIFRIRSMTKPIVSVAAMMLYDDDVFRLDDLIEGYLPEEAERHVMTAIAFSGDEVSMTTVPPIAPVTIRQIFSHTSGAAYDFNHSGLAQLAAATGEDPGQFPLVYQPGMRWNYSVSTDRLGELVEESTQVDLDRFLRTRIFEPLGMTDSSYSVPAEKIDRVVTAHQRDVDGALTEVPNPDTMEGPALGRSGLFSTAPDYARFLQMLLNRGMGPNGSLLLPATVDLMRQNHIGDLTVLNQVGVDPEVSQPFPINAGVDKFGLGFQVAASPASNPDLRAEGSFSWSGLQNTHFWVDPVRGIGAVIMMQQLPFYDDHVMELVENFEILVNRTLSD